MVRFVGDVELEKLDIQPLTAEFPGRGFTLLRIARRQHHGNARLAQLPRHLEPQPLVCAGDESNFFCIRHNAYTDCKTWPEDSGVRAAVPPIAGVSVSCYTCSVARKLMLSLDDDLLRAARKVAVARNTSVNQLVRDYLVGLVRETDQRQPALVQLDQVFRTMRVEIGRRRWKRQDLHQR